MYQVLGEINKSHNLSVDFLFKGLNPSFIFLNQLELFHSTDCLIDIGSKFLERTFQQSLNQESNILQCQYFIGMIPMVVFAD